jgi:hypothetical protein
MKISGEHTLSDAVLRELSPTGVIEVSGLGKKGADEFVSVPIAGFRSNVLCDRHNSALSPLDAIGHRFFKSFRALNAELRDKTRRPRSRSYLFNGHDIERYILKILCGDGFANKMQDAAGRIRNWRPSVQWIRILYGLEPFPAGWGLYLAAALGRDIALDQNSLGVCPVINEKGELCGARFQMFGLEFELLMTVPNRTQERYAENCRYRPAEVLFDDGRAVHGILFGWDTKGEAGSLTIAFGVTPNPEESLSKNARLS